MSPSLSEIFTETVTVVSDVEVNDEGLFEKLDIDGGVVSIVVVFVLEVVFVVLEVVVVVL